MSEAEWLACTDPIRMVEFLRGSPAGQDAVTWWNSDWRFDGARAGPDRRFHLFACACCRRVWDRIPEPCNRDAVAAVEQYVDGTLPASALQAALTASSAVEWKPDGSGRRSEPGYWAVKYLGRGFYKLTAAASALEVAVRVAGMADEVYGPAAELEFGSCFYTGNGVFLRPFEWPRPVPDRVLAERAAQAALLRCVFGNPFRLLAPDARWRTADTVGLARRVYEEREFDRLPLLADALMDAGCDEGEILGHCRSEGPHTRGCWVVDWVLGKA